ncbi:MAG TPA: DUF2062 domain-containing protein [Candidatus Solibacter sp.]|jgi:hypothetical protein|nr:DUF2062 domain-containing protein [Candidatus Solibacter sp.]
MRDWPTRFRAAIAELPPEQVPLLLVVGLVIGVFPIMGIPTVLCLLASLGLRLNTLALQLLNNITSPLQWALLLPFARAGAWICGGRINAGAMFAGKIGVAALHAVAGWLCICVPLGILTYLAVTLAMRRRRQSWCNSVESPA